MPSPFPGVDPYFEDPAFWEEFHHHFITECTYHLTGRLPSEYIAKTEQRVELISRDDPAASQYIADVAVSRQRSRAPAAEGGVMLATDAVTIPAVEEIEVREASIHILRLPDYQLITVIELLSPPNKFGDGVGEYRRKRNSLLGGGIHVVELDLLVRGQRTRLARPLPPGDYCAMVFDADRKPDVDVWSWTIRQPFPAMVPIPLKKPDPPVPLDLAAIVGTLYDRGHYARKLRYRLPCPAPVSPADAAWAEERAGTMT